MGMKWKTQPHHRASPTCIYLLGRYVMVVGRMTEIAKFRYDVHDCLDWGIFNNAPKRAEIMAKVKGKEAA